MPDLSDVTEVCEYCGRYRGNLILDGGLWFCNDKHADRYWNEARFPEDTNTDVEAADDPVFDNETL